MGVSLRDGSDPVPTLIIGAGPAGLASAFGIAPRTGEPVRWVRAADGASDGFVVETARATYRARAVVVATGFCRVPSPERLPDQERSRGPLLHSSAYRNGDPFADQRVHGRRAGARVLTPDSSKSAGGDPI